MVLKFLTKYANGYLCAATSYYPSCAYAENGGLWKGASEDYVDYATWLEDSINSSNSAEFIKGQTAQVNVLHYVKDSENWTKFVDDPFSGSASIRTEVASIPGYVFLDNKTPQQAIDAVLAKLRDYIKQ